jgi:hypothetical protein
MPMSVSPTGSPVLNIYPTIYKDTITEVPGQLEHTKCYPSDALDFSTFFWYLIMAFHGVRIAFWHHPASNVIDDVRGK